MVNIECPDDDDYLDWRQRRSSHDSRSSRQSNGMRSSRGSRGSRSTIFSEISFLKKPGRNLSVFADIEATSLFQNTTLLIIVLNAGWMAVDVNWNHPSMADDDGVLPLEPASVLIENFFCAYFFMEVVIRFFAFKRKWWWFMEGMFVFDTVLVVLMVLETWIVPIVEALIGDTTNGGGLGLFSGLRLLRLARVTRMVKLMSFFPELVTLVRGALSAFKAVSWVLIFLLLTMYVFAIIFTTQLGDADGPPELPEGEDPTAEIMFSSMGSSCMTLFTNGVLGDNLYQTMDAILTNNGILFSVFSIFFVISALMLLNMLIGVLCQVVEVTAKKEEEESKFTHLRESLTRVFEVLDVNTDGNLTTAEWDCMLRSDDVKRALVTTGIPAESLDEKLKQLGDTIFSGIEIKRGRWRMAGVNTDNGRGLTLDDFMEKMKDLHPDSRMGALDLEEFRARTVAMNRRLNKKMETINRKLQDVTLTPMPDASLDNGDYGYSNPSDRPNDNIYPPSPAKGCEKTKQVLRVVPLEVLLHALRVRVRVK